MFNMQTISITLKSFDSLYIKKALSEIRLILYHIDNKLIDKKDQTKKNLLNRGSRSSKAESKAIKSKELKNEKANLSVGESSIKIKGKNFFKSKVNKKISLFNLSFFSFPKARTIYTVIRSPHIDKKSREQFELKKYKNQLIIKTFNLSQVSILLFFLKNCQFPGVELKLSVEYSTFLKK